MTTRVVAAAVFVAACAVVARVYAQQRTDAQCPLVGIYHSNHGYYTRMDAAGQWSTTDPASGAITSPAHGHYFVRDQALYYVVDGTDATAAYAMSFSRDCRHLFLEIMRINGSRTSSTITIDFDRQ